jgi:single-strand DNA-binding protein
MNKVFLIGNLTKNPELSTTGSGISVCKFTLAVSRRFSNKDGVRDTDVLPVFVWREQADPCNKYLKKGSKAAV